ncbi:sigma-70 family RNA polymerase sigma factor [Limnoglobus roseus]|nr:sigma-70 family RNA polymerase sigma factor [Limnoglobus roseus]
MHYTAYRMHTARTRRELRKWQQYYLELRNRIVVGNRKLIFRAVRAFAQTSQMAEDLAAECHIILIHAVVAFNPWMGIRFSTYAYTCLLRALSRQGKRAMRDLAKRALSLDQFVESEPPAATTLATPANHQYRLDEYLRADHPLLSAREKVVIIRRFNLTEQSESTTLEDVGREIGLSKERVRQVQASAITKLRKALTVSP